MQGLALALGKPVCAMSTHEAIAPANRARVASSTMPAAASFTFRYSRTAREVIAPHLAKREEVETLDHVIRVADVMQRDNVALACARRARAIELRGEESGIATSRRSTSASPKPRSNSSRNDDRGLTIERAVAADLREVHALEERCFPVAVAARVFRERDHQRQPLQPRGPPRRRRRRLSLRDVVRGRDAHQQDRRRRAVRRQGIALALMQRCIAFAARARRDVDLARSAQLERRGPAVLPLPRLRSRSTSATATTRMAKQRW